MIQSYYLLLPGADEARQLLPLLPPWRQEKARRLQNDKALAASVGAGLLLMQALKNAGLDPRQEVRHLGAGKPVLRQEGFHFSLSHSGPYALCVLGDGPLGADVQEDRPAKLSIARRFAPGERQWLEGLPEEQQHDALMSLWARKEAWVKAESAERMLRLDEYDLLQNPGGWVFSEHLLPQNCRTAVCAREPAPAPLKTDIQSILNTL